MHYETVKRCWLFTRQSVMVCRYHGVWPLSMCVVIDLCLERMGRYEEENCPYRAGIIVTLQSLFKRDIKCFKKSSQMVLLRGQKDVIMCLLGIGLWL